MINVNDYLVCKKDFIQDGETFLTKDKSYKIQAKGPKNILIGPLFLWFNLESKKWGSYIWDYFYTTAELRNKRIHDILN